MLEPENNDELPPLVEGNRNGREDAEHCHARNRHSDSGGLPVRRQASDRHARGHQFSALLGGNIALMFTEWARANPKPTS